MQIKLHTVTPSKALGHDSIFQPSSTHSSTLYKESYRENEKSYPFHSTFQSFPLMVQKSGRAPPWQCIKPVVNNGIKLPTWHHSTGESTGFLVAINWCSWNPTYDFDTGRRHQCAEAAIKDMPLPCKEQKNAANVVNVVGLTRNCWEIGSTKWKLMSCHAKFALGYFFLIVLFECFLNFSELIRTSNLLQVRVVEEIHGQ